MRANDPSLMSEFTLVSWCRCRRLYSSTHPRLWSRVNVRAPPLAQAPLGGACWTVYTRTSSADILITPATDGGRFTVLLNRADLTSLPLTGRRGDQRGGRSCRRGGCGDGLPWRRRIATAGRPETSYDSCSHCRVGDTSSSFDQRSHKCPAKLLEEKPPLVALARHPVGVDLSPYHEGVIGGDVNHVVEDDEGPAGRLPFTTVVSHDLI